MPPENSMPSTLTARPSSRAAQSARARILKQLREDHKRVKTAFREFQSLDHDEDREACDAIVQRVLDDLAAHAALEEELLYPASRGAIDDEDLIDEAEIEHESMHGFIDQLRSMSSDDDKYTARFTVLCEYVLHHVKEEEGEIFPQLERAALDWESLALEMDQRRQELAPADARRHRVEGSTAAPKATVALEDAADEDAAGERLGDDSSRASITRNS
jgi:hemerythrin superfamily protein